MILADRQFKRHPDATVVASMQRARTARFVRRPPAARSGRRNSRSAARKHPSPGPGLVTAVEAEPGVFKPTVTRDGRSSCDGEPGVPDGAAGGF
jgi:hypothetical protein